jgi:hypothetical protein
VLAPAPALVLEADRVGLHGDAVAGDDPGATRQGEDMLHLSLILVVILEREVWVVDEERNNRGR